MLRNDAPREDLQGPGAQTTGTPPGKPRAALPALC